MILITMDTFLDALNNIVEVQGLITQRALAKRAGLSQSTISSYVTKQARPRIANKNRIVKAICDILNMTETDIVRMAMPPPISSNKSGSAEPDSDSNKKDALDFAELIKHKNEKIAELQEELQASKRQVKDLQNLNDRLIKEVDEANNGNYRLKQIIEKCLSSGSCKDCIDSSTISPNFKNGTY